MSMRTALVPLARASRASRAGRDLPELGVGADVDAPPIVTGDLFDIQVSAAIEWAAHLQDSWAEYLAARKATDQCMVGALTAVAGRERSCSGQPGA